jgi:hypothetical protein
LIGVGSPGGCECGDSPADEAGGVSADDGAGRDVLGNDGAGGEDGLVADGDAVQDDDV